VSLPDRTISFRFRLLAAQLSAASAILPMLFVVFVVVVVPWRWLINKRFKRSERWKSWTKGANALVTLPKI